MSAQSEVTLMILRVLSEGHHAVTPSQLAALVNASRKAADSHASPIYTSTIKRLADRLVINGEILSEDCTEVDGVPLRYRMARVKSHRNDTLLASNTDELFAYFVAERERAAKEPDTLRSIALKSAHDSEWHTLWSAMMIPAMRAIYDESRIAKRLDVMRAELTKELGK